MTVCLPLPLEAQRPTILCGLANAPVPQQEGAPREATDFLEAAEQGVPNCGIFVGSENQFLCPLEVLGRGAWGFPASR